jgi:hypothetical protein
MGPPSCLTGARAMRHHPDRSVSSLHYTCPTGSRRANWPAKEAVRRQKSSFREDPLLLQLLIASRSCAPRSLCCASAGAGGLVELGRPDHDAWVMLQSRQTLKEGHHGTQRQGRQEHQEAEAEQVQERAGREIRGRNVPTARALRAQRSPSDGQPGIEESLATKVGTRGGSRAPGFLRPFGRYPSVATSSAGRRSGRRPSSRCWCNHYR